MNAKSIKHFIQYIILLSFLSPNLYADKSKDLRIAGWDVYADPERADKTIGYKRFEQKTGVNIKFTPLSSLDDIVNLAEAAKHYDLFIISNEGIKILHDMGLVMPLDLHKLPNYQNLHHNLKYSSWSQFDSQVYAVPWAWGPTGLMFNKDLVKTPDNWNVLWDPKYKGKVGMWDDISMIWTTALSLGYTNVYSLTREQLDKVKQKLFKFNSLQAIYYKDGGDELILATKGKLALFNSWYDPSARLKTKGKNFSMIIPKEGAVGMFDSYMLSKNTHHNELALQYINHQISPEVQNQMVKVTGLAPSNIETLTLLKPEEIRELHLDDANYFNRMLLWDHMPRKNLYDEVLKAVRKDFKLKQKKRQ